PAARFISMAAAGVYPRIMGIGPVPAIHKLLAKIGRRLDEFDRIEINEAFAAQVLACTRSLGLTDDAEYVNGNGGAIALGHPLGASGARLAMTGAYALRRQRQSRAWSVSASALVKALLWPLSGCDRLGVTSPRHRFEGRGLASRWPMLVAANPPSGAVSTPILIRAGNAPTTRLLPHENENACHVSTLRCLNHVRCQSLADFYRKCIGFAISDRRPTAQSKTGGLRRVARCGRAKAFAGRESGRLRRENSGHGEGQGARQPLASEMGWLGKSRPHTRKQ